ncbi:MAG: substrate-binding periplasmic protein [Verrucomicrobiota bacterium]
MVRRVLFIFLIALNVVSVRGEVVRIVGQAWFPYIGREGDAEPGFLVEIAAEALSAMHHQVEFRVLPWKLANQEVAEGISNALIGTTPQENPSFVFGKTPLAMSANAFFVREGDDWEYKGMESLKGKRVGFISPASYGAEFDQAITQGSIMPMPARSIGASNTNVRALVRGESDVILDDFNVIEATAKKIGSEGKIRFAGFLSPPEPVYLGFSPKEKNAEQLAEDLDKGLEELRLSGKLNEILKKYGLNHNLLPMTESEKETQEPAKETSPEELPKNEEAKENITETPALILKE